MILEAAQRVNQHQRHRLVRKLQQHLRPLRGSRIALLGLAFKPETDDTRDAPAITIAQALTERGAIVRAYDPMVKQIAELPTLQTATDTYTLVEQADAVVLLTEWAEFRDLDFKSVAELMRGNLVIDGRNAFDPSRVREAGLVYEGMGRGALPPTKREQGW